MKLEFTQIIRDFLRFIAKELRAYWPLFCNGLRIGGLVIIGSLILWPLINRMPMLGWDWVLTFQNNDGLVHPPYLRLTLSLITWMPWRDSLGLLNSITLVTTALAVWQKGGRYGTIMAALVLPPLWMVLWDGQLEGLILLGIVSEIPILTFLKPNLGPWALFKHWGSMLNGGLFLLATLLIWPFWFLRLGNVAFGHPAAMGWGTLGWPILLLGLVMLLGAGKDPYRLLASGCLISPYLMPYHFLLLIPGLGAVRGYRQIVMFLSFWVTLLSLGLGGWFRLLGLLCPLSVYLCLHSWSDYKSNIGSHINQFQHLRKQYFSFQS